MELFVRESDTHLFQKKYSLKLIYATCKHNNGLAPKRRFQSGKKIMQTCIHNSAVYSLIQLTMGCVISVRRQNFGDSLNHRSIVKAGVYYKRVGPHRTAYQFNNEHPPKCASAYTLTKRYVPTVCFSLQILFYILFMAHMTSVA